MLQGWLEGKQVLVVNIYTPNDVDPILSKTDERLGLYEEINDWIIAGDFDGVMLPNGI